MRPSDLITAVRDRAQISEAEMAAFGRALGVREGGDGVSDAQAGAFAMAVTLNGLSDAARVGLTLGMRDSGETLSWALPGPVIDKHSTGGIGDPVSLVLAPLLAACDAYVPMISGRGLGFTGGTLDKLEAIPGLSTDLSAEAFEQILRGHGCVIAGATTNIAPADKRLYAIRDVTGTVRSVDLITSSILAKKLAEGLDALILDVKCGSGAVFPDLADAQRLARALVSTANGAGCKTEALITDMSQPLTPAVGNTVELDLCVALLQGEAVAPRLREMVMAQGARLLAQVGVADGAARLESALHSGAGYERFAKMIAAMGGDVHAARPKAPVIRAYEAREAGVVNGINGQALGHLVVRLGGGRVRETDQIDHRMGITALASLGAVLERGDPVCMIAAASESDAEMSAHALEEIISLGEPKPVPPLIHEIVSEGAST